MARKFNSATNNSTQRSQGRAQATRTNDNSSGDVGVVEVFISDDIDLTQESRDYYAEALLENMEENMPPILNRIEIPFEIMEDLSDLVMQSNEKVYGTTERITTEVKQTTTNRNSPSNRVASPTIQGNTGRSVNVATSKQRSPHTRRRGGR